MYQEENSWQTGKTGTKTDRITISLDDDDKELKLLNENSKY